MAEGYEAIPKIPPELQERYQVITEVLAGALTVSEAARRLGISRNRFQTLLHRSLAGLIEGMSIHPAGRPKRAPEQRRLQDRSSKLERDNERLKKRVQTADRILELVQGMLKGQTGKARRSHGKHPSPEDH